MHDRLGFSELLGFGALVAVLAVVAGIVASSRLPKGLKQLIYAALALRVVGAVLRYTVLFEVYRGIGDARGYYGIGLRYAARFAQFDFSPFYDQTLWERSSLWGTQFVAFPSGIILTLIGPSFLGEFLAFSLLAFVGLTGFAIAFRRSHPDVPLANYARWIWLFPSLWYWPSSVGKEAIVMMGLGLAVAGFVGKKGRINWLLMAIGTFFVFAIRPQVAAVVIFSMILAQWLSLGGRWTIQRSVQGALLLGLGVAGLWYSMNSAGIGSFDADGVQTYMETQSEGAAGGGSAIEGVNVGLSGVPIAMLNILARPFVWEAHNLMALLSAVEIAGFWVIVWYRRRNLRNIARAWRSDRFLRFAVPFILIYAITLGMLVANLGIIARQRVFLFPFLFLLLECAPVRGRVRRAAQTPRRRAASTPARAGLPAGNG